ncbi:hypothetical protein [Kitasatospora sp. NPDC058190]|uniref:hypothetical protein n=1 Tax=Kitasatospora sp. NPDC058190 TaxID=3346371 RepID=UPI0036D9C7EE
MTENIAGRATGKAGTDARPPREVVPGNPLRALASPVLWRASIHLVLDGLVALAGLAALVVAACLAPAGLVGLPLTVAAGWALFRLAAVERHLRLGLRRTRRQALPLDLRRQPTQNRMNPRRINSALH